MNFHVGKLRFFDVYFCVAMPKSIDMGQIDIWKTKKFLELSRRIFVKELPESGSSNSSIGNIVKHLGISTVNMVNVYKKASIRSYHEHFENP